MVDTFKATHNPSYQGCPTSHLQTILLFFNLTNMHGVSNTLVEELLSLLGLDLFPKDNTIPKSLYEAKTILKKLKLNTIQFMHVIMDVYCLKEICRKPKLVQSVKSPCLLKGQLLFLARCFIIFYQSQASYNTCINV
jgi:hypothetical protein